MDGSQPAASGHQPLRPHQWHHVYGHSDGRRTPTAISLPPRPSMCAANNPAVKRLLDMQGFMLRLQARPLDRLKRIFWVNLTVQGIRALRQGQRRPAGGRPRFLSRSRVCAPAASGFMVSGHLFANRPDEALQQIQTNILPQIIPGVGPAKKSSRRMFKRDCICRQSKPEHSTCRASPSSNSSTGHGLAGLFGLSRRPCGQRSRFLSMGRRP